MTNTQPPSWTQARDAAAESSLHDFASKCTFPGPGSTFEIGFVYGANWARTFELERLASEHQRAKALVEALEYSLKGLEMWRKFQSPGNIADVEETIRRVLAYGGQRDE